MLVPPPADLADPVMRVYDAALGSCTWKEALESVSQGLGARAATLCVTSGAERREVVYGLSAAQANALRVLDYPWLRSHGEPAFGTLAHGEELPPPLGKLARAISVVASQRADTEQIWLTLLGLQPRTPALGRSSTAVAWHLRHALRLECSIRCERSELDALIDEIDQRKVGWMVIDQAQRVRLASRVARALRPEDGVCALPNGHFFTSDPRLGRKVRAALGGRSSVEQSPLLVARPPARPLMVSLRGVGSDDGLLCARRVAVVIRLPDVPLTCDEPFLRSAYGLTAAEARFARLLVEGLTVREAAGRAGVTMNTARTHLKRVFAKTQTRRQAELMSLLAAGLAVTR